MSKLSSSHPSVLPRPNPTHLWLVGRTFRQPITTEQTQEMIVAMDQSKDAVEKTSCRLRSVDTIGVMEHAVLDAYWAKWRSMVPVSKSSLLSIVSLDLLGVEDSLDSCCIVGVT
jgi:hypothetical protein